MCDCYTVQEAEEQTGAGHGTGGGQLVTAGSGQCTATATEEPPSVSGLVLTGVLVSHVCLLLCTEQSTKAEVVAGCRVSCVLTCPVLMPTSAIVQVPELKQQANTGHPQDDADITFKWDYEVSFLWYAFQSSGALCCWSH